MKDNLFEMLLNLFETSLNQLKESHEPLGNDPLIADDEQPVEEHALFVRSSHHQSTRVFTYNEQIKLTKASHQFLLKMKQWNIIDNDLFELIMNQLQSSESRIVTLQETKWTIRNSLAPNLNEEQLSFLDLVLYQTEDKITVH